MLQERDMRPAVEAWLKARGCQYVVYEVLIGGYCDMVGVEFEKQEGRRIPKAIQIIAVELKLENATAVIRQARGNSHAVDQSYAAMPYERCERMTFKTRKRFVDARVGLLSVGAGCSGVATRTWRKSDFARDRLAKKLWQRAAKQRKARL